MAQGLDSICFYCGQAFSISGLNRVRGGRPCPVCTERLLEALPPLIPGPGSGRQVGDALADVEFGEAESAEADPVWGPPGVDFPEPA
jgi:hypothetical protein